jgi:RNA polymerase sigma factor (sigma-70 family)
MEELLLEKQIETKRPDFVKLYKEVFPKVARYIGGKGGTLAEAKDVFQDALIIYYEKISIENVTFKRGEYAFIFGTAKNMWIDRYRQKIKELPFEQTLTDVVEEDEQKIVNSRILLFLEKSGRKCMDLLQSFYYQKLPMTAIAERFGFSGIRSATVQKYKCIEKVRDIIKEKSLNYEDFLE